MDEVAWENVRVCLIENALQKPLRFESVKNEFLAINTPIVEYVAVIPHIIYPGESLMFSKE
jgi:hypothetical protein